MDENNKKRLMAWGELQVNKEGMWNYIFHGIVSLYSGLLSFAMVTKVFIWILLSTGTGIMEGAICVVQGGLMFQIFVIISWYIVIFGVGVAIYFVLAFILGYLFEYIGKGFNFLFRKIKSLSEEAKNRSVNEVENMT